MKVFIIFLFSMSLVPVMAHDPDQAFFNFDFKADEILVEIEVPWTFRKALNQAYPALMNQGSEDSIALAAELYLKKHFILRDENQKALILIDWQEQNVKGHGHQGNFLLRFPKAGLSTVENTVMMDLYETQINHHHILQSDHQFTTTLNASIYEINMEGLSAANSHLFLYGAVGLFIIASLMMIRRWVTQVTDNQQES